MILAVVLTIVFILVEGAETSKYKSMHKQESRDWIARANYRFEHHCDSKKI